MRMRRQAACGGERRHSAVPRAKPLIAEQVGLVTATDHGGDRASPTVPKPAQVYQPSLIVRGGPQDGITIRISKSPLTMGYLLDNDIVVIGPMVSRRHAEIVKIDGGFHIWDLGMSNGTFVNQQHIGEMTYPLKHGDHIRLANCNIYHVFSCVEVSSPAVALPSSIEATLEESLGLIAQMPELLEPPEALETTPDGEQSPDGWNSVSEEPASPHEGAIYEGNVRLKVGWDGGIQLLIGFATMLRTCQQIRVVRLVANSPTDVEISLSMREPIPLEQILAEMAGVSQVTQLPQVEAGPGGPERVLQVRLGDELTQDLTRIMDGLGTAD